MPGQKSIYETFLVLIAIRGRGWGAGVLYMRAEEGFCVSLLQALALKYGGQTASVCGVILLQESEAGTTDK
jgi:hypothetical protein